MSIISALSLVGYPVVHVPYCGEEETYIAFHIILTDGVVYADGTEQAGEKLYSVDLFTQYNWEEKAVAIKLALESAGYRVQDYGPEIYEQDTNLYHIPMTVVEDS